MEIICHRGLWRTPSEQNSFDAFARAFEQGFGVETDIRDAGGKAVIAHDLPTGKEQTLGDFLALSTQYGDTTLALNIKSDGLQEIVGAALQDHGIRNYFVFDMSIPDMLRYARAGIVCYCRESEFEKRPLSLFEQARGVWMDCFDSDWITPDSILPHLSTKKNVCLVSPELHGRPHAKVWAEWRGIARDFKDQLQICTDFPLEARSFFA